MPFPQLFLNASLSCRKHRYKDSLSSGGTSTIVCLMKLHGSISSRRTEEKERRSSQKTHPCRWRRISAGDCDEALATYVPSKPIPNQLSLNAHPFKQGFRKLRQLRQPASDAPNLLIPLTEWHGTTCGWGRCECDQTACPIAWNNSQSLTALSPSPPSGQS
jgi:hypothetical protein